MGKNNNLINSLKAIAERNRIQNVEKASNEIIPPVYAAVALALHKKYGFGYKRINDVFVESQRIWEEFSGSPDEMVNLCEEKTGISVIIGNKRGDE